MTDETHEAAGDRGISGRHVLAAILVFFAIVVVADAVMIYKAVSTFGGLENANAYREGLAYNARIARAGQQAESGWRDSVAVAGDPARLEVVLRGQDGAQVTGKALVAEIGRPATNRFDATLALTETSPGVYAAAMPDAGAGSWIVHLKAFAGAGRAGEPVYQAKRRLWIKP